MSLYPLAPLRTAVDPSARAVPAPSSRARWAAYGAAASATVGFLPLHVVWALGIPFLADPDRFRAWYDDGGGTYLLTLNLLALAPAVLALALVRPWGLTFPRWVPAHGGRPVPRLLLVAPGTALWIFLLGYTAYAAVLMPLQWNDPDGVFDPRTGLFGIPQFLGWAAGLAIATRSYARRTRPAPSIVDR